MQESVALCRFHLTAQVTVDAHYIPRDEHYIPWPESHDQHGLMLNQWQVH